MNLYRNLQNLSLLPSKKMKFILKIQLDFIPKNFNLQKVELFKLELNFNNSKRRIIA